MPNFRAFEAIRSLPTQRLYQCVTLVLAAALIALAVVIYMLVDARSELDAASSDNKTWTITQFEVDYQDFLLSLQEATFALSPVTGDLFQSNIMEIQQQFDIFYSRITVFITTLRNFGIIDPVLDEVEQVLRLRDELALRVDSLNRRSADAQTLETLLTEVQQMQGLVRQVSVGALHAIVEMQETARKKESQTLLVFLLLCVFLIALLIWALVMARFLATSHLKQQMEIAEKYALSAASVDMTSTAIIAISDNDKILSVNSSAENMLALDSASVLGKQFKSILKPLKLARLYRGVLRALQRSTDRDFSLGPFQMKLHKSNGDEFVANITFRQSLLPDGKRLRVVFVRDVTSEVVAEQRLTNALEAAETHANAQQRFVATMSHEVRTPLHGMGMVLELMLQEPLPARLTDLVRKGQAFCKHALYQADYVLDTIRMANVKENLSPFEPVQLVRDIRDGLVLTGQCKDDQIQILVNGPVPDEGLIGQPMAFSRAVSNLMGNAAKYAAGSEIIVALTFTAATAEKGADLQVEVTDRGPGIAEAELDRVLKPFQRGQESSGTPGFGLGLFIVKNAVEMMGGTISLQTTPGEGCRFVLLLPLKQALGSETNRPSSVRDQTNLRNSIDDCRELSAADPWPPNPAKTKGRALVVDDAKINCELSAKMFAKLGYATDLAYDGKAAIEMAAADKYDVILMDIFMPQVTGTEAAQEVRRTGASTQAWIIGTTARADDEGLRQQILVHMDGHLLKPFGLTDLQSALPDSRLHTGRSTASNNKSLSDTTDLVADLRNVFDLSGCDLGFELVEESLRDARLALSIGLDEKNLFIERLHRAAGAASMGGMRELGRALLNLETALRDERSVAFEISRLRDEAGVELARGEEAIETLREYVGQGSDTG